MLATTKLDSQKLLNFRQLRDLGIHYSREHLWRLERTNRFPRRVRLSPQKIAWLETEIQDWLREKLEARASQEYAVHD